MWTATRKEAIFHAQPHTFTSPRPEKYLDSTEAGNRCALVSRRPLTAASGARAARVSTPASSKRPVIQNKRLLRLSALADGDRPTEPYTCSAWPLVAARRFWMSGGGETYRDLFGATHGQSPSACIVVEPNQTSALGVSPPWKLRASVPAGRFFATSIAPLDKKFSPSRSQQKKKKSRRQKLFPGCDVTINP